MGVLILIERRRSSDSERIDEIELDRKRKEVFRVVRMKEWFPLWLPLSISDGGCNERYSFPFRVRFLHGVQMIPSLLLLMQRTILSILEGDGGREERGSPTTSKSR